ncbi:MAG TPA: hypothetical protein VFD36_10695 [Kofleriaceae bacterium]|nr:hypothetical protein [Kofleriaceae bacterium]
MILAAVMALVARAAAAPTRDEAIRYANALTGVDPDGDDDAEDRDDVADEAAGDCDDQDCADDSPLGDDDDANDSREVALSGSIAGEPAALEAGAADPGTAAGDDVSFAAASAGAAETYESWMRHQRPSSWGRLDLGLAWRRRWSEPMQAMSRRYDEVWLVATWRR